MKKGILFLLLGVLSIAIYSLEAQGLISSTSWTAKANLPKQGQDLGAAVLNGKLYIVGGYCGAHCDLSSVQEYDPTLNAWANRANMLVPHYAPAAASVNGKLYALGGVNEQSGVLASVEEFDPVSNSWTNRANMSQERYAYSAVALNGKIYAIGGQKTGDIGLASMEEFDPLLNTWTLKADMPTARVGFASVVANGKIYVIGGRIVNTLLAPVYEYDPLANSWATKASIPTPRETLAAVEVNGKILALGGNTSAGGLSTVELYDPNTDTWTSQPAIPSARNECFAEILNGVIYVFGGHDTFSMDAAQVETTSPDLFSGLVAYYPFNSSANDESGNANNGNVSGAILTTNRFGAPNSAYRFAGDGSHISIPNSPSLDMTNAITLAVWLKIESGGLAQPRILHKHVFDLGLNDTSATPQIFLNIQNNPSGGASVITAPISFSQWLHIVGTFDRQTLRLYTNGVLAAEKNAPVPLDTNSLPIGIGQNLETGSDWFKGSIDDIAIYNRALSSAEVQQLFQLTGDELPTREPSQAKATGNITSGFLTSITVTDNGFDYTNTPSVHIIGGGGTNASAIPIMINGTVGSITVLSAGGGFTNAPRIVIDPPVTNPKLQIAVSAVTVVFNSIIGKNYQFDSSNQIDAWTPLGEPFTASDETTTNVFQVQETGRYFRVRQLP